MLPIEKRVNARVDFICFSHFLRMLLNPLCHSVVSKMFRENTAEASHWRAGLREALSHTMQVSWSYASLHQN